MSKQAQPPDGLTERSAEWHLKKFIEFTRLKLQVREPLPHMNMFTTIANGLGSDEDKLWRLGCYLIPYNIALGHAFWQRWPVGSPQAEIDAWLTENWPLIVKATSKMRRCVFSLRRYTACMASYRKFIHEGFPRIQAIPRDLPPREYYQKVWDEVTAIDYFGRYIAIRMIEGLRRVFNLPAELPDLRAMDGAWSPRRCLVYLAPDRVEDLLTDSKEAGAKTEEIARHFAEIVCSEVGCPFYVFANTLCEYRSYFEDRNQYVGYTIDKDCLPDKVLSLFDPKDFWALRGATFPKQVLGEHGNRWHGLRIQPTQTLRDHGYIWSDMKYDYTRTTDFSSPARR